MLHTRKTIGNIATITLWCIFLLITSCNGCKENSLPRPEIDAPPVKVTLKRFEKDLFHADTNNLEASLKKLHDEYGVFYTSFARDIMQMPYDESDPLFVRYMRMLLRINRMKELQQTVDSAYADVSDLETQLGDAMGKYHHEFPMAAVPDFITFVSEFSIANLIFDSSLCIGLDMYMGERYKDFYLGLEFPEFRIKKLQRAYIVPNTVKSLAYGQYETQTAADKRFMATMIFEGKVRYFTKALLPHTHDSLIMGYTGAQLEWCKQNEVQMWTHYAEKNLLYNTRPADYMRYVNDGPFTVADGVPPDSAPAIGAYTGWQIVNSYMKNNRDVSLADLMNETDFEKILKQSKYRPQ